MLEKLMDWTISGQGAWKQVQGSETTRIILRLMLWRNWHECRASLFRHYVLAFPSILSCMMVRNVLADGHAVKIFIVVI